MAGWSELLAAAREALEEAGAAEAAGAVVASVVGLAPRILAAASAVVEQLDEPGATSARAARELEPLLAVAMGRIDAAVLALWEDQGAALALVEAVRGLAARAAAEPRLAEALERAREGLEARADRALAAMAEAALRGEPPKQAERALQIAGVILQHLLARALQEGMASPDASR